MGRQRCYPPIGRIVPEWLDAIEWNEWPEWIGIDGRHPVERVEPFNRNRWPESAECALVASPSPPCSTVALLGNQEPQLSSFTPTTPRFETSPLG